MPIPTTDRFEADVVAAYGRNLLARDAGGALLRARPFGRDLAIVCGDRVRCSRDTHGEVLVTEVLPRRTALWRSNTRGAGEAVVANLSLAAVVIAALPRPDLFMVDRYLCAVRSAEIATLIIVNKSDLPLEPADEQELQQLVALGFPLLRVAAKHGIGLDAVDAAFKDHTSVLLGQSGVGKSSLIRRLAPDGADAAIGELMRESEGRHTTTASHQYLCRAGGTLIDSPGVRDFAPSVDHLRPASLGFPEVERVSGECRFQDCKHLQEPQCAVRDSVSDGRMSARRYESYRRLRRLFEKLQLENNPTKKGRR